MEHTAKFPPNTLLVFIDETGNEDLSDPKNPMFGRGGIAVLSHKYKELIKAPWRELKSRHLGGASKAFHATDFERSIPRKDQYESINKFMRRPFARFAAMIDSKATLPEGVDAHKAVSLMTIEFVTRLAANQTFQKIALIFEASERGDTLVKRDFDLARMDIRTKQGLLIPTDGYFLPKTSREAGLEVADLIVHTAGRQKRHEIAAKNGIAPDFKETYWHSPIPPLYMAITGVELNQLANAEFKPIELKDILSKRSGLIR